MLGYFTVSSLITICGLLVTASTSSTRKISVLGNGNSNVPLSCNVPVGSSISTIQWSHNGVPITASDKYVISYSDLRIMNVVPSDEGEYTCSYITRQGSMATITAGEVCVLGAAQFVQPEPQEVCVYRGEDAKFDTRLEYVNGGASGRNQTTSVLGLFVLKPGSTRIQRVYSCSTPQDQPCPNSTRITVEKTPNSHKFDFFLRLKNVTESDVGTYIVRVETVDPLLGGVEYILKEFSLNVKEPPPSPELILQTLGSPVEGHMYTLSCQVDVDVQQYANFDLQWTNSVGDIISSGQDSQLNVSFDPLIKHQHEGQYTCSMVATLNGSELRLTSNKTIAVLVEARNDSEVFQIVFGPVDLKQCTNWMLDTKQGNHLEEAIRQEITQVVSNLCNCDVTMESIETNYLKCLESNQLGYRATFSGTHTITASDFVTHIESWLSSADSVIKLGLFMLNLDDNCPARVPSNVTATSGWCADSAAPSETLLQCINTCVASIQ